MTTLVRPCYAHLATVERKRIVMSPRVLMRLNRGERPEPLPEELRRRIALDLRMNILQQYPSYPEFYAQLTEHLDLPAGAQIVVGAGIEEFIRTLMFLCCGPGERAAVLWPTCAMYDIYAQAFGVDLQRIIPRPRQAFTVDDLLRQLPTDTKVLFLPNPGQPVETHFYLEELRHIAAFCQQHDILFAVDEAHWGFGATTAIPLVAEFDNLLVMQTFSKFFGAASIRVGYAVGQARVIKPIDGARPSGEIAGPSMQIASTLLKNYAVLFNLATETMQARDWLRETLVNELGMQAWGTRGFSLLVEFRNSAQAQYVAAELAASGVYVKVGFPNPIAHTILLACGSMRLMKDFYAIFKGVVQ